MSFPDVSVQVGFNAGATTGTSLVFNDATRGLLDTATLGENETYFSEIVDYVRSFSLNRPSSRVVGPVLRYEAGTSTAVLNNIDRRFDPTNLSGPYVSAGVSQVKPMRIVAYRATYNGVVYDLWYGHADDWPVSFTKALNYSEVVLTATDPLKALEANERAEQSPAGAGEDAGARINRILDSADWPAGDRIIATGDTALQATTLAGPALAELQLTSDTEIGQLYVDAAGRIVFRNRHAWMEDARSTTSQATFGMGAGELKYSDVKIATDIEQLVNRAAIARANGAGQWVAEDPASILEYLVHGYSRSDLLMETEGGAADYAALLVHLSKDPELRFSEIEIKPMRDPDTLFPEVLGRQLGDRIMIKLEPAVGPVITRECFVSGIRHDVSKPSKKWTTTYSLQAADNYDGFLVFNNAAFGQLDSHALAF